jgi:2-dehydro-3-deoxygalactonokinase
MTVPTPASFVGLDMGTTNTRAWRVEGGRIVARASAAVGIRDAAVAGSRQVIRSGIATLLYELGVAAPADPTDPPVVVAAGMITSNLGLAEVPHVAAPAGLRELAAGVRRYPLPELEGLELHLIPGVRTGHVSLPLGRVGEADVMRGEETLCMGLVQSGFLAPGGTLLNLGSHWKVVRIDDSGRIGSSHTSLSGELLHAAQTRTILAGSVPPDRPGTLDAGWAAAGRREARRSGLSRALFCVRLLEQRTECSPAERLAYLAGAFVEAELDPLLRSLPSEGTVLLAGGGGVAAVAVAALTEAGREVRMLDPLEVEEAMVRGLWTVAAAAGAGSAPAGTADRRGGA